MRSVIYRLFIGLNLLILLPTQPICSNQLTAIYLAATCCHSIKPGGIFRRPWTQYGPRAKKLLPVFNVQMMAVVCRVRLLTPQPLDRLNRRTMVRCQILDCLRVLPICLLTTWTHGCTFKVESPRSALEGESYCSYSSSFFFVSSCFVPSFWFVLSKPAACK